MISMTQPREQRPLIAVHHALQLMLKRVEVVIPYAGSIGDRLPSHRSAVRRAFPHVLNLIRAVALLFQYQRLEVPAHGDTVVATLGDYAIARDLAIGPLGRILAEDLSSSLQKVAGDLWAEFADLPFTPQDAAKAAGYRWPNSISPRLKKLREIGIVEEIELGRGRSPGKWRMNGPPEQLGADLLPTIDEIEEAMAQGEEDLS